MTDGQSFVDLTIELIIRVAHLGFAAYGIYLMFIGELDWFIYGFILFSFFVANYNTDKAIAENDK